MTNPEQPRHRFNPVEYLRKRSKTREVKKFIKLLHDWEAQIDGKIAQAKVVGLPARFTNQGFSVPENGYYYSVSYVQELGAKVLIIDRDREKGHGERHAVVCTEDRIICLKTINPIDPSGDKNPHVWKTIRDPKERDGLLEDGYRSFKDAQLVGAGNTYTWRGYYHDASEVLSAIPE